jgi:hypothetical protein
MNTIASTLKKKDSLTEEAYLLLGYVGEGYSERDWFYMILVALPGVMAQRVELRVTPDK